MSPLHSRSTRAGLGLIVTMVLMGSSLSSLAADNNTREREALRRAQLSLQQAQQERDEALGEKSRLSQENSKLTSDLAQVGAKVRAADSQSSMVRQKLARLEADLAREKQSLSEATQREGDLTEKVTALERELKEQKHVASSLLALVSARTDEARALSQQNQAMYAVGLDLIDLYRSDSPSKWLKARDTLLGYREVRVENLAESMRDKLDAAKFKALEPGGAPAPVLVCPPAAGDSGVFIRGTLMEDKPKGR